MKDHILEYWDTLKSAGDAFAERVMAASKSPKEITATCYFLKLRNTVNASMLLLQNGLAMDAEVLTRVMFENTVYLRALSKEDEETFSIRYTKDWAFRRRRTFKEFKERVETRRPPDMEEVLKTLAPKMESTEKHWATLPPELVGHRAGLDIRELALKHFPEDDYRAYYQYFHDATHSLPPAVEYHLNHETGEFIPYPTQSSQIDSLAMNIFGIFLNGMKDLADIHGLEVLKSHHSALISEALSATKRNDKGKTTKL